MPDTTLYDIESVLFVTIVTGIGMAAILSRLRQTRPDLSVGRPIALGVGIRLLAVTGLAFTGLGTTLGGGDEIGFVRVAREVAASGLGSDRWLPSQNFRFHEVVFALQIKFGDLPELALRVTQIGISMLGIVLILAAIYDLAGPRAAHTGAWVLALEPASIFFNSTLHREPLLVLASGLIVLGGTKIWAKLELRGILLVALGCVIAVGTRPYAGWFLITGGLVLILHASLRQVGSTLRSLPLIYTIVIAIVTVTPAVLKLTSQDSLEQNLQGSQNANTAQSNVRGVANSNNLSLEQVDFSTRSDLVANLPRRARDVVLRPYPWQVANTSQRLGAIGTLVVFLTLYLLVRYVRRSRGQALARAAPMIYPGLFLLVAYALSVGNAGTGFRYRTHLVLLALAALVVLREHALRDGSTSGGRSEPLGPGTRADAEQKTGRIVASG